MSNEHKTNRMSSVTTSTETAGEETETSLQALTPREEKVLRMVHGMSEDDSRALQFALGADEETRLKLAMIEGQLIQYMAMAEETEEAERISPAELLSSWLDGD